MRKTDCAVPILNPLVSCDLRSAEGSVRRGVTIAQQVVSESSTGSLYGLAGDDFAVGLTFIQGRALGSAFVAIDQLHVVQAHEMEYGGV